MMTYIILSIVILFAAIIGLLIALYYRNTEITEDIETAQQAIEELESFTYHNESEIKDWIEEGIRDIQYDLDEHASKIEDLDYTIEKNSVTMEEVTEDIEKSHETLRKVMNEDFENVGVLINTNLNKIQNITKYLSKTSGYRPEPNVVVDAGYEDYCKSFDEIEIWTDKRLAEHYKCLALMLDDGVYHPDYKDMGCETTYKYYLELTKGDNKDEMGNKETVSS